MVRLNPFSSCMRSSTEDSQKTAKSANAAQKTNSQSPSLLNRISGVLSSWFGHVSKGNESRDSLKNRGTHPEAEEYELSIILPPLGRQTEDSSRSFTDSSADLRESGNTTPEGVTTTPDLSRKSTLTEESSEKVVFSANCENGLEGLNALSEIRKKYSNEANKGFFDLSEIPLEQSLVPLIDKFIEFREGKDDYLDLLVDESEGDNCNDNMPVKLPIIVDDTDNENKLMIFVSGDNYKEKPSSSTGYVHTKLSIGEGSFKEIWAGIQLNNAKNAGNLVALSTSKKDVPGNDPKKPIGILDPEIYEIIASLAAEEGEGGVLPLLDKFDIDGTQIIAMKLCNYGSLFDLLNSSEIKLDGTQRQHIAQNLIDGLKKLHDAGIYHRDLRIDNMLVEYIASKNQYNAFIGDFDLAATSKVGHILHQSPQIILNPEGHEYNEKDEVWSLGIMLYTLFYGKMPEILKTLDDNRKIGINTYEELDDLAKMLPWNSMGELKGVAEFLSHLLCADDTKRYKMQEVVDKFAELSADKSNFENIPQPPKCPAAPLKRRYSGSKLKFKG